MRVDKLSASAAEAFQASMGVAGDAQATVIEPIHLLKAVLDASENNLQAILRRIGTDPAALARSVDAAIAAKPKSSGGMPISAMRIMPISVAHSSEYHGPSSTEHTMLIKCAMGHIPSTRSIGEMTTPRATSMESTAILRTFEFFISNSFFRFFRNNIIPPVGDHFLPLTPKHGFPRKIQTQGAPLLSARDRRDSHSLPFFHAKRRLTRRQPPQTSIYVCPYVGITQIRFTVKGHYPYLSL